MSEVNFKEGLGGSEGQFEVHNGYNFKQGVENSNLECTSEVEDASIDVLGVGCRLYEDLLKELPYPLAMRKKAHMALAVCLTEMDDNGLLNKSLPEIAKQYGGFNLQVLKAVCDKVRTGGVYPGLLARNTHEFRFELLDQVIARKAKRSGFVLKLCFAHGPGIVELLYHFAAAMHMKNKEVISRKLMVSEQSVLKVLPKVAQEQARVVSRLYNALPRYPLGED